MQNATAPFGLLRK